MACRWHVRTLEDLIKVVIYIVVAGGCCAILHSFGHHGLVTWYIKCMHRSASAYHASNTFTCICLISTVYHPKLAQLQVMFICVWRLTYRFILKYWNIIYLYLYV
jgi:hypothetical protein